MYIYIYRERERVCYYSMCCYIMLCQFTADLSKSHVPLLDRETLPGLREEVSLQRLPENEIRKTATSIMS